MILEEWSHAAELKAAESKGTAKEIDPLGNVGIIGWYVPGWLAEEYPDILDYKNLNKYADKFKTSESGDKGQFLGADPNFTAVRRGDREEPRPQLQGDLLRW